MSGILDRLLAAVEAGGGLALALALLAENLFPPIPSEVILPLAGFAVQRGQLPFVVALLAATAGSTAGAAVLYAAGRFGGRRLLYRFHWLLRLDEDQLDRADAWFDRKGSWLVLWGRMVPFFRSVVSVPAGFAQMPVPKFLALTALGSLAWNSVLISAGMVLGERWTEVRTLAQGYSRAVIAVTVLAAALLVVHVLRSRRGGPDSVGKSDRRH